MRRVGRLAEAQQDGAQRARRARARTPRTRAPGCRRPRRARSRRDRGRRGGWRASARRFASRALASRRSRRSRAGAPRRRCLPRRPRRRRRVRSAARRLRAPARRRRRRRRDTRSARENPTASRCSPPSCSGSVIGTRNGERRRAPRSRRTSCPSSSVSMPPIEVPITTPTRSAAAASSASPAPPIASSAASSARRVARSTRRDSLTESPRGPAPAAHSAAIRTGSALGSKRRSGPTPLVPATAASHVDATSLPSGDTQPRPVTTTRRRPAWPCMAAVTPPARAPGCTRWRRKWSGSSRRPRPGSRCRTLLPSP